MELEGLLTLFDAAATLKHVPRAGWLLRGVPNPESVADHSYGVSLVALALTEVLNASGELRQSLDRGRVLTIALLHDLAECQLTDLPNPALRHLPRAAKHAAEAAVLAELTKALPSTQSLLELWTEYEAGSSPEGRLVRDADRLEMMVQCLRYERAGSRMLDEFWVTSDAAAWHYPLCEHLYRRLKKTR
jgi:putative hydrolases of HD superfamily